MSAEDEAAVIEWIRTFEAGASCESLSQLWDGVMVAQILHEIVPEAFPLDGIINDVDGKWAIAAKNVRTVIRALDSYFTTALLKKIPTSLINENNIARQKDVAEILSLLQWVVGVAVFCDRKTTFIQQIFNLSPDSQAVLKALVQQVMETAEDMEGEGEVEGGGMKTENDDEVQDEDSETALPLTHPEDLGPSSQDAEITFQSQGNASGGDAELLRTREMLRVVTEERQRLVADVRQLEAQNESLKGQIAQMAAGGGTGHSAAGQSGAGSERDLVERDWRERCLTAERDRLQLQQQLEDVKHQCDLHQSEFEVANSELKSTKSKLEASLLLQAKLEMESRASLDELEISRAKLEKLAKAEVQVEKLTKKLEELLVLKREKKELQERLDNALDQVHEYEAREKERESLGKALEQSRNANIEKERLLYETQALVTSLETQRDKQREEAKRLTERLRGAEEEAKRLRVVLEERERERENERKEEEEREREREEEGETEEEREIRRLSEREVRERLRRVMRENTRLRNTSSSTAAEKESDALTSVERERLSSLQLQVVTVTRQLKESEAERDRLSSLLEEKERERETKREEESFSNESLSQRVTVLSSTVSRLEDRLKERENVISLLQSDKQKLELYAKRSLSAFRDKFLSVLTSLRTEKAQSEEQVKHLLKRLSEREERWRREERLLSSALFEVGVKVMDRAIYASLSPNNGHETQRDTANNSSSAHFLSVQREALGRVPTAAAETQQSSAQGVQGVLSPEAPVRRLFPGQTPPPQGTAGGFAA